MTTVLVKSDPIKTYEHVQHALSKVKTELVLVNAKLDELMALEVSLQSIIKGFDGVDKYGHILDLTTSKE